MYYSPLRYPGGKGKLAPFIELLLNEYGLNGGTYIEPFAGGAGIACELLAKNLVSDVVINDLDKGIYSFWKAVLTETDRFIEQINNVNLNMNEWNRQRDICINRNSRYSFELGFATFFLNRTNRSGIIKGGVIGGKEQTGKWLMDARFNKEDLINRIEKLSRNKSRIHIYNKDIESFLNNYLNRYNDKTFIYFDPPYFKKGKSLYLNFFQYEDHVRIERLIREKVKCDWIITYDNEPKIEEIYSDYAIRRFELNYSVAQKKRAKELIIFKEHSKIPKNRLLRKNNIGFSLF